MKQPVNIGKTAIIVKQGKWFVVKTRYAWARKTRAQFNLILSTDFVSKKRKWIQVEFCLILSLSVLVEKITYGKG